MNTESTPTELQETIERTRIQATLDAYNNILSHDNWLTDIGRLTIVAYVDTHQAYLRRDKVE